MGDHNVDPRSYRGIRDRITPSMEARIGGVQGLRLRVPSLGLTFEMRKPVCYTNISPRCWHSTQV